MSEHRSDVGFIELDINDRPGGRSTSLSDRPDGLRRAVFHDLFPDGTATRAGVARPRCEAPAWHRRTLRIALAMKGGLSLAVWIGGAVAGLDILRRIRVFDDHGTCRAILLHKTDAKERNRGGADPNLIRRATEYAQLLRSRRTTASSSMCSPARAREGSMECVRGRAATGVGFDTMLDTCAGGGLRMGAPAEGRSEPLRRGHARRRILLAAALPRDPEDRRRTRPGEPAARRPGRLDLSATLLDAVDSSDRTTAEGARSSVRR